MIHNVQFQPCATAGYYGVVGISITVSASEVLLCDSNLWKCSSAEDGRITSL